MFGVPVVVYLGTRPDRRALRTLFNKILNLHRITATIKTRTDPPLLLQVATGGEIPATPPVSSSPVPVLCLSLPPYFTILRLAFFRNTKPYRLFLDVLTLLFSFFFLSTQLHKSHIPSSVCRHRRCRTHFALPIRPISRFAISFGSNCRSNPPQLAGPDSITTHSPTRSILTNDHCPCSPVIEDDQNQGHAPTQSTWHPYRTTLFLRRLDSKTPDTSNNRAHSLRKKLLPKAEDPEHSAKGRTKVQEKKERIGSHF